MKWLAGIVISLMLLSCADRRLGKIVGHIEDGCLYLGHQKELHCPFEGCTKCPPGKYRKRVKRNMRPPFKTGKIFSIAENRNENEDT